MKKTVALAVLAAWLLVLAPAFADKASFTECKKLDRHRTSLGLKIADAQAKYDAKCARGSKAEWCEKQENKIKELKERKADADKRWGALHCKAD